jgi:hypothetical protein
MTGGFNTKYCYIEEEKAHTLFGRGMQAMSGCLKEAVSLKRVVDGWMMIADRLSLFTCLSQASPSLFLPISVLSSFQFSIAVVRHL